MCLSVYLLKKTNKQTNKQTKCRLMKEKKAVRGGLLQKATSELKAYWRGEVIQREDLIELF